MRNISINKLKYHLQALNQKGLRVGLRAISLFCLIFLIILLPLVYLPARRPKTTIAAWWDDNWTYRKAFSITAHSVSETNVYLNITGAGVLNTSTATGIGNQLQSDCGDLRFTDQKGKLLPYYLVSGCLTTNTTVHVFMENFPAGAQTIYIYYGNANAPNGTVASDFSTAASGVTLGSAASQEITQGPVAHWKFDEGTGNITDSTANKMTGAFFGSTPPLWNTEDMCLSGKCLYYNGSTAYIEVSDPGTNSVLDFISGNAITISAWIKPSSLPATPSDCKVLMVKADTTGITEYPNYGIEICNESGKYIPEFYYYDSTRNYLNEYATDLNVSLIQTNVWQHIAFTYTFGTGSSIRAYYNGRRQNGSWINHDGDDAPYGTGNSPLAIGASGDGAGNIGQYFHGFIDEIKIYRYARSEDQIRLDYETGISRQSSLKGLGANLGGVNPSIAGPISNGLVGYWKMDENSWATNCSTASAADSSGNDHHAIPCPNGSAPSLASGKFGNAGNFDGIDDYLVTSSNIDLTSANKITVSFWLYWNSYANDDDAAIESSVNFNNYDGAVAVFPNSGSPCLGQAQAAFKMFNYRTECFARPSAATWHHWAIIFDYTTDDGDIKVFIDGREQTTTVALSGTYIGTGNFGNYPWYFMSRGTSLYGAGKIDEVRIYNRALSPSEVSVLYNWAPGPVGYWKLNEGNGTNAVDASGQNNTLNLDGGNPQWGNGKFGKSLSFNGTTDYATSTNGYNLNENTPFTVSAWIRTSDASQYGVIIGDTLVYGDAPALGFQLYIYNGYAYFGIDKYGWGWSLATGTTLLANNTWYHLTGVYDGTYISIYVNGVREGQASKSYTGMTTNNRPIRIGSMREGYYNEFFLGEIDEVRIYNYTRDPIQIIEDMNAGHPTSGSPVGSAQVIHKYDECAGTIAHDSSPNGNDGNLGLSNLWRNDGKYGCALNAELGSDFLDDVSWIDSLSELTIAFWINPSILAGNRAIIGKAQDDGTNNSFVIRSNNSNTSEIDVCIAANTSDYCGNYFTSYGLGLTTNTWQHIVVVYDGTLPATNRVKVYRNGKQIGGSITGTIPSSMTAGTTLDLAIGGQGGGMIESLKASYDEVYMFTFPLTDNEIKLLFNGNSSIFLGVLSDTSQLAGGLAASSSAMAQFCIPGDTSNCNPPVGFWRFEEADWLNDCGWSGIFDVYDSSGNTSNGASCPNGSGPKVSVSGKVGHAAYFDGSNDYFVVPDKDILRPGNGSWTISAWMKPDNTNQLAEPIAKVEVASPYGYVGFFFSNSSGDGAGKRISGLFYSSSTSNRYSTSNSDVIDGNWHYFSMVADKSADTVFLYMDGKRLGATNYSSGSWPNILFTDPWQFGGGSNDELYMQGYIDNIVMYNYARTPAQIAWDYNRGAPVAYWKLDECQGTTAYDSSGNELNGTITITPGGGGSQDSAGACTTSAATAWYNGRNGKFNYSINLDGTNDYITVTDPGTNSSLDMPSSFSLSAWIYLSSDTSSFKSILSKGSGSDINYYLDIDAGEAIHAYACRDLSSSGSISTNQWHHLVYVFDDANDRQKIYIDGRLSAEETNVTCSPIVNNSNLEIGAYAGGTQEFFPGKIDELKIYHYPLTENQVLLDFNQQSGVRFGPATGAP